MAESKYSLRLAAVDAFSKTFGDFSKKAGALEEDIKATRSEISKLNSTARDVSGYAKLEGQLGKTKALLQQTRVEQASLGRAHTEAAAKVEQLGVEYAAASAALKKLETATGASTAEVSKARAEQRQLGSALAGATAEVKKLETAQDKNTASVRTLESAQRAEANQLKRLETALTGAGVDTAKLATEQKRLESATEQANAALQAQRARLEAVRQAQGRIDGNRAARADLRGQMVETAAIGYMAAKPVAQAMELEVAMADVAKVIKFEGNQREDMARENLKLASDRLISSGGITAVDLAKIQYAAGQSGIGNDEKTAEGKQRAVMDFTRDAAIMGGAFDLGAEDAGSIMAGWRASMGLDREKTLDLANATNHLGNSFNATPAEIAAVVKRYGAVGQASGLKPEQSAALAAALINPGTEKEVAGTGMKNFLAALTKGDASTKGQREAWASLGMDPGDLARQMHQDAPGTMVEVLKAIKAQPIEEQSALTTQLFGSESIGAIMPLLQNLGAVEKAFGMVANSADRAGSMMVEAEQKAGTSRGAWDAFVAKVTRLSTTIGMSMLPALNAVLVPLGAIVDGMSWFADTFPLITSGLAIAAGGLAALKVGALGLKFVGLMVGQAFNRAGLARAKLDATTLRSATTADAAVLRLNAAMARMGAAGGLGGAGAGGRPGKGGKGLGGKLAGLAGRGAAPLVLAAGAMNLASVISDGGTSEEIGGAAGSTAGGLGGMWAGAAAGAAIGSVVPIVGTAAGGIVGGAIGGLAGSSAGEWIGEKLGALVDRLSSPEATAKEIVTNTDNRQTTFAPVITIQGADQATSQALGDSIMQRMKAEMLPMMAMDPLAVRRGAALTDGSN
jgi:TP901 family phage tail tape measure protein